MPAPHTSNASGTQKPGNIQRRPASDPNLLAAVSVPLIMATTAIGMFGLVLWARPVAPEHPLAESARAIGTTPLVLEVGTRTFANSCALCHAPDATGVPRLGKPLRNSAFVQERTDDDLFDMISSGRMADDDANTTGAAMPPRGGSPIKDEAVRAVVAYLRSIQDKSQPVASLDAWIVDKNASVAQSGDLVDSIGHELFVSSCSACHGQAGEGLPGLGKALDTSEFVGSLDDAGLIKFIKMGRPTWDAENSTGIDMPPKGGNPALTDEQLKDIVSYMRSIHE